MFEGFQTFDPSTRSTAWPRALPRGRPERGESRDDDFLTENVGIGKIVGFLQRFVSARKVEIGKDPFIPLQRLT